MGHGLCGAVDLLVVVHRHRGALLGRHELSSVPLVVVAPVRGQVGGGRGGNGGGLGGSGTRNLGREEEREEEEREGGGGWVRQQLSVGCRRVLVPSRYAALLFALTAWDPVGTERDAAVSGKKAMIQSMQTANAKTNTTEFYYS